MSAKKSFDVQSKAQDVEKPRRRKKRRTESLEPTPRRRKSLRTRRQEVRGKKNTFLLIVLVLICGAVVYGLWQPHVRITSVSAGETQDEERIAQLAERALSGTYYGVVPRNSFFFYPERELRTVILDAYPSISALTIRRTSFTELSISSISRASAFLWCGTPETAGNEGSLCYETDAEGFVFKAHEEGDTSLLRVHAALDAASSSDSFPLRAKVEGAAKLPDILRFARAVSSLGIPLRAVAIRNDEADLYSAGGTRITYVIGKEREATRIAESTFSNLNFMDGSVEYVDLRFDSKAYIKRAE